MTGWGFAADTNPLIGKVLARVEVSPDRETLIVRTGDGLTYEARTQGDCCSESWIEHLTVPPDIAGATVVGVKDTDFDGEPATDVQIAESEVHREYLDVLIVYQTAIVTDRGEVVIEYRNNSNGYYGGSLEAPVAVL